MAWSERRRAREEADAARNYVEALEHRYSRTHGRALVPALQLLHDLTFVLPRPMTRLGGLLYVVGLAGLWFWGIVLLAGPIGILLALVASTAAVVGVALILQAKPPLATSELQRRRDEAAAFARFLDSYGAHTGTSETGEASHG